MVVFTIFFLLGCKKNQDEKCPDVLTDEEYNILPYSNNQILVFKCNSGLFDTVYCTQGYLITNYTESDYDCISGPRGEYFQLNSNLGRNWGTITREHIQPIKIDLGWSPVSLTYLIEGSTQNNITINSLIYNNVYVLTKDSTSILPNQPWRIYYTIPDGILKYDYTNNEFWEKIN